MREHDARLCKQIADDAYVEYPEGVVTLASGQTSNYYIEMSNIFTTPVGLHLVGRELLWALQSTICTEQLCLVGVPLGGLMAVNTILSEAYYFGLDPLHSILVRRFDKHGDCYTLEGVRPEEDIVNDKYIVVDDVVTTGESALKIVRMLQSHLFNVIGVHSIVNRSQAAIDNFAEKGIDYKYLYTAEQIQQARD
jgi:orotate phosphoribosyltransferase